jgi:hypothetical protein
MLIGFKICSHWIFTRFQNLLRFKFFSVSNFVCVRKKCKHRAGICSLVCGLEGGVDTTLIRLICCREMEEDSVGLVLSLKQTNRPAHPASASGDALFRLANEQRLEVPLARDRPSRRETSSRTLYVWLTRVSSACQARAKRPPVRVE